VVGHVFDPGTFDFHAVVPPRTSTCWAAGAIPLSVEYLGADAPRAGLRGLAFDQVRTRLFIRPGFYDALEFPSPARRRGARGVRRAG